MEQIGRLLLVMGVLLALLGLILMLGPKLPFRLGRLPLDFHYRRDNFSFYFPLGTSTQQPCPPLTAASSVIQSDITGCATTWSPA